MAVGGYGRGTLFPHSDVDVLVLLPDGHAPDARHRALRRPALGLRPRARPQRAHRRRVRRGGRQGRDGGHEPARVAPRRGQRARSSPSSTRASRRRRNVRDFFDAKVQEQTRAPRPLPGRRLQPRAQHQGKPRGPARPADGALARARRGPRAQLGGARRSRTSSPRARPPASRSNERVLQDLRIRLHHLAGRREDRLVFDHQIEIARQLKLKGAKALAASDLLMRRYYLAAKAIWRFNQILLANLFARSCRASERKIATLDADFRAGRLNARPPRRDALRAQPGQDPRGLPAPAGRPRHREPLGRRRCARSRARCRGSTAPSARTRRTAGASWRSCAASASRGRCGA